MASGPDQPPAGPPRLAGSLARHRWAAAAGMTAAIAAVAGGGLALALHDSSPGPPKECGLVPCAAALPASVQSSRGGPASAPATTAPTAAQRATAPPGPARSPTPASVRPGPRDGPPASGAPGRAAAAAPPAGRPAAAEPVSVPEARASCATVIAFTAGGTLSTPVRCTFSAAVRQLRTRDGSGHPGSQAASQDGARAGGQLRPGRSSHHGWQVGWLGDWLSRGWSGSGWPGGGRPGGGWSGGNWSGGGWSGGGQWGQHGGWPGGR